MDEPIRRTSDIGIVSPDADLIRWWPLALVGPYVLAIRFGGVATAITSWLLVLVAAGLAIGLVRERRQLQRSAGVWMFGGFLAYTALSLLWSPDPARGIRFAELIGVAFLAYAYGRTFGPPGGGSFMFQIGYAGLVIALVGLVSIGDPASVGHLNADRILAMGVIALVVIAWYGPRSRVHTLGVSLLALGTVLISGSRTASVVVIVLLITAPGLRLPKTGRWALAGSLIALVLLLSITPAFQDRWFESGEGDFWNLTTLDDVQTSGRNVVWPIIIDSCRAPVLGEGAGASDSFAFEASRGFPEPHNEYLRVWCDTGLVGSFLFWGFVVLMAIRALPWLRTPKPSWSHVAAAQMVLALLLLSMTDNPLTTTVPFMIPVAMVLGWSEKTLASQRAIEPGSARKAHRVRHRDRP